MNMGLPSTILKGWAATYLITCETGGMRPQRRKSMLEKATNEQYGSMGNIISQGKINKSPNAPIEHELVKIRHEHKSNGRKVSKYLICIKA